jgi:integrase
MARRDLFHPPSSSWNAGRIIRPKPPLKPKHIWAIWQQLKNAGRVRDLALFNCGIDAKLRGCDLVRLRVSGVAPGGGLRDRVTIIQQKTGRPVPFEITDATRDALAAWLTLRGRRRDDWLFPSRSQPAAICAPVNCSWVTASWRARSATSASKWKMRSAYTA